ncbi:MAG: HlyD family efflux transporter periplasmic adaptor subunit [Patescibacteria group bacterium]
MKKFNLTSLVVKKKFASFKQSVTKKAKTAYTKVTAFIKRKPLGSLVIAFLLLFVVLFVGQVLRHTEKEVVAQPQTKKVKVYSIGDTPKATFQAAVEKEGVVEITAQTAGIVQYVAVTEGTSVDRGQTLVSLSSNYQGGNAASVQRQIAQEQYQNVVDTFDKQKDTIAKQKDIATRTDENTDRMREISQKSNEDTNSQIDNTNYQIDQLNDALDILENAGVSDQDEEVQSIEGQIKQAESGLLQLRSSQRTLEYQGSIDNPPAKLSDLQKDLTLQQLDIQERALQMNREVARLQVSLAYVSEAMMAPASPFAGTVERIYVNPGESVSPGTVLAVVSGTEKKATAVLQVPQSIAHIISKGEPSTLTISDEEVSVTPYYVSSEATDGNLYSVFYDIPEKKSGSLSDGDYLSIAVPVDTAKTSSVDPYVPVDAVYQTQDASYVLVIRNGKAETRSVKLGSVYGNSVQVVSGLQFGDQVILDRNVIAGDKISIN